MNSKPVSEQLAKTFVQTRMIEILFYSNCWMGRSLGGILKVIFVLFFVQYPLQPVLPSCIYEAGVLSSGQGNQSRNRWVQQENRTHSPFFCVQARSAIKELWSFVYCFFHFILKACLKKQIDHQESFILFSKIFA